MKNGAELISIKAKDRPKDLKTVNLALQGGGSHGAFTWGVLDRLLDDTRLDFDGISGASAGAINGALLTYGLLAGGRTKAQSVLADFWSRVSHSSIFGQRPAGWPQSLMPNVDATMGIGMDYLARTFSPYQFNPMNYNPLRSTLEDSIDYEVIRNSKTHRLFVGATNVLRGSMRIFETHEITADTLLASACLPLAFQAVTIDGEHYWDGGYLGNPTLYPLIQHCRSRDILIIRINPTHRTALPTDPISIADRMNEISFNASLQSEIEAIELINHLLNSRKVEEPLAGNLKDTFLHQISDEAHMASYGAASKLSTDRALINELHDYGYRAAETWLPRHFASVGDHSTYTPITQVGLSHRTLAALTEA